MQFLPGTVLVTQSGPDLVGRMLAWSQQSWWTHAVLVTSATTYVHAWPGRGVLEESLACYMHALAVERRAWVALDEPSLTDDEREAVVATARAHIGRRYDYVQAGMWLFNHGFRDDAQRFTCSRLVTATYQQAVPRLTLFRDLERVAPRLASQLALGYCTPRMLLSLSVLEPVAAGGVVRF